MLLELASSWEIEEKHQNFVSPQEPVATNASAAVLWLI